MVVVNSSCKGRKFYRNKLDKLRKSISCQKKSIISNDLLSEKNKIRFMTQFFRWFKKDFKFYKMKYFIKKKSIISNLDTIDLCVKIQKAGFKNLLLKLNYYLSDYKTLKRRSYSLYFRFLFINVDNIKNKEITLDIRGQNFDKYNIFITTDGYYLEDFYFILNALNKRDNEKKKADFNDDILYNIEHVYQWNRYNEILRCEAYMSWFLKRDDYYEFRASKFRREKKYNIIIKERKFTGIFPLKNIRGYLVVMDKKNVEIEDYKFFQEKFRLSYFKKQRDFFLELKDLVDYMNNKYQINSIIVYFYIEYLHLNN